ncbi:transmembrane protein [Ceratobasidium sp. AG-Ba]|nr:transmembrane protein [Ceratobasidium sp. AG-Ba]
MKLGPLLLAAPVVLQLVAADPRPTPAPNQRQIRRALDRWHFARQTAIIGSSGGGASQSETEKETTPTSSSSPTSAPAPTSTSSPPPTSTSKEEAPTSSSSPPTSRDVTSSTPPPTSSTPAQTSNNQAPATSTTTSQPPVMTTPPPTSSNLVTTDHLGSIITSVVLVTYSAVSATPTAGSDDKKGGMTTGTTVGLAVTGSIAGLIIILLIVWKLTGKRFSDLEDSDDNAIKWPELNKDSAAMTPLPARPTGRSGVETNALDDFDSRSATQSTANLTDGPYQQPYSDDPGYGARPQYYDPYGGVPGTARPYASPPGSHDGDHKNWGVPAEGGQYYDAPMRGASPGPNMAYADPLPRGASPGPNMAYGDSLGRGTSPGPNMAYADPTGRTASPAPAGYGGYYDQPQMSGRLSPGPNLAYGGSQDHGMADPYGRQSPAPGMGGYGARAASPGPNVAYNQGGYR